MIESLLGPRGAFKHGISSWSWAIRGFVSDGLRERSPQEQIQVSILTRPAHHPALLSTDGRPAHRQAPATARACRLVGDVADPAGGERSPYRVESDVGHDRDQVRMVADDLA
jgi:hypothetical protein